MKEIYCLGITLNICYVYVKQDVDKGQVRF